MRRTLVAGNWKLNGSLDSVRQLVEGVKAGMGDVSCDVAVCPPFVYIPEVAALLKGSAVGYGSQDVADQESGAFTGEISVVAEVLKKT